MTLNKIEQSKQSDLYISQPAQNTAGSNSSINIDFKYETGNDTQAQTPAKASLRESEAARESSRNANEASIKNISYTKLNFLNHFSLKNNFVCFLLSNHLYFNTISKRRKAAYYRFFA